MGLNAILKDKGRIASTERSSVRVEGAYIKVPITDAKPFKCRLDMPKETESTQDGRHRRAVRPKVIVGRKVRLEGDKQIDIQSKQVHGHDGWVRYTIDGTAEPYRKKNTVIGWEAYVSRVE